MKSLFNKLALACFRLVPSRIARHFLFLLRSHPALADQWGYHIRPIHYYEPLPDFREITPACTTRRRSPPTIEFNLAGQVALMQHLAALYRSELEALASAPEPEGFNFHNDYFAGMDAALYYAFIRDLKPARVIEIGSGYSTRIADKALRRNRAEGRGGELICIEPYPQPRLTEAKLEITLVQKRVEELAPDFFAGLQSGDILFIDSSHAVKFGSDVCHEFLEILPRLQPGVWVHVHDIFSPQDYPAEWLIERRVAWNEQYLLEAFLSFNDAFVVKAAVHWIELDYPEVADLLKPNGPGRTGSELCAQAASFWMQHKAD